MDKKVYYYDNDGLFTVSERAYLDQQMTSEAGKDIYYCPDGATLEIPPETKENETVQFNGSSWAVIKDYRHKFVVNSKMEISEIDYLGEIKDGYILLTNEEYTQILSDEDFYIIKDGNLIKNPDYEKIQFQKRKEAKISENEQKRQVEYINTPIGKLKTETPLGDLKTALPLYDKLAAANNGLPANSVRLYVDGVIQGSPSLTLEEYNKLSLQVALEYIKIDAYSTQLTASILKAKSIEELNQIVIDYENLPEVQMG